MSGCEAFSKFFTLSLLFKAQSAAANRWAFSTAWLLFTVRGAFPLAE